MFRAVFARLLAVTAVLAALLVPAAPAQAATNCVISPSTCAASIAGLGGTGGYNRFVGECQTDAGLTVPVGDTLTVASGQFRIRGPFLNQGTVK